VITTSSSTPINPLRHTYSIAAEEEIIGFGVDSGAPGRCHTQQVKPYVRTTAVSACTAVGSIILDVSTING